MMKRSDIPPDILEMGGVLRTMRWPTVLVREKRH
jgi:hypothetical protein